MRRNSAVIFVPEFMLQPLSVSFYRRLCNVIDEFARWVGNTLLRTGINDHAGRALFLHLRQEYRSKSKINPALMQPKWFQATTRGKQHLLPASGSHLSTTISPELPPITIEEPLGGVRSIKMPGNLITENFLHYERNNPSKTTDFSWPDNAKNDEDEIEDEYRNYDEYARDNINDNISIPDMHRLEIEYYLDFLPEIANILKEL